MDIIKRLENKAIKPTANRILVLRALAEETHPVSLADLEGRLGTLDKSSIFRVLTLFLEHDVAHALEDGSGSLKYELCTNEGVCNHSDTHIHFFCESCRQTFCFKTLHVPAVELPEGFTPHTISYVVKGECPQCKKRG